MTTILLGYAALALIVWFHSLYALATRTHRRERRLFGIEGQVLLAGVALLTSVAWILFVPFYAVAWAHWAYERRGHHGLDHLWNRGRGLTVRPAHRAA